MPLVSSSSNDLLIIVGPTTVGKTALSITLAQKLRGEIISCDSMQVYKGMDIGTAKASQAEQQQVPHHLIDLFEPDFPFSLQSFQELAREKIAEIHSRRILPVLVGGTGLYIQSITHGYQLPDVKENSAFRQQMMEKAKIEGNASLYKELQHLDLETANKFHPNDLRRIIRALEIIHQLGKPLSQLQKKEDSPYQMAWIGLTMPRDQLYDRINHRVDQMIEQGWLQEVSRLYERGYGPHLTSMQAIGYNELISFLKGECFLEDAVGHIKQATRRYAKRQLTWFRRLKEIQWFDVTKKDVQKEIWHYVAGKFPGFTE